MVNKEISQELADPHIVKALLATTFKGFNVDLMRQAIFEGVIRGWTFKHFLQKDVYAIKYGQGYNLVTSIDLARKISAQGGVIGKTAPTYTYSDQNGKQKVESCAITVYTKDGHASGFTAEVYYDEYSTGQNLWLSKPRTMLAKVAEMHALRMACPEALAKVYTQEEFDKERGATGYDNSAVDDNADVTSSGDDLGPVANNSGASQVKPVLHDEETPPAQEIPQSEDEQLRLINAKAIAKWPNLPYPKLHQKIEDLCGIPLKPANYKTIIIMLS